jgi:hypothetical protein
MLAGDQRGDSRVRAAPAIDRAASRSKRRTRWRPTVRRSRICEARTWADRVDERRLDLERAVERGTVSSTRWQCRSGGRRLTGCESRGSARSEMRSLVRGVHRAMLGRAAALGVPVVRQQAVGRGPSAGDDDADRPSVGGREQGAGGLCADRARERGARSRPSNPSSPQRDNHTARAVHRHAQPRRRARQLDEVPRRAVAPRCPPQAGRCRAGGQRHHGARHQPRAHQASRPGPMARIKTPLPTTTPPRRSVLGEESGLLSLELGVAEHT